MRAPWEDEEELLKSVSVLLLFLVLSTGCTTYKPLLTATIEPTRPSSIPAKASQVSQSSTTLSLSNSTAEPITSRTPTQFSAHPGTSTITPHPEQSLQLVSEMSFRAWYFSQSPDQELIAVNENDFVKVYQAATEDIVFEFEKPFANSPSGGGPIEFSPDGTLLAADVWQEGMNGPEGVVYVWTWPGHNLLYQFYMPDRRIFDFHFSSDSQFLAIASSDGWLEKVEIWNVQSGGKLATLETPCYYLAFSPTQPILATGELLGLDDTGAAVKLWDLRNCKTTCPIQAALFVYPKTPGRFVSTTSVDFSKDGHWLAAVIDGGLRIWDLEQQQEVRWPAFLQAGVLDEVAFSEQGILATLGLGGHVTLFTPETGEEMGQIRLDAPDTDFPIRKETFYTMHFSSDGKLLLTAGVFSPLQIWAMP